MLEKILAATCAPALAGIKPSNIASVRKSIVPDVHSEIITLNRQLNSKDIYILPLCECDKRVLVIVYRRKLLDAHLKREDSLAFLRSFGYNVAEDTDITEFLAHLQGRLDYEDFPHEIGIFLGYPVYDIRAFMTNKDEGCLLTGEWKVYREPEKAQKLFCRYKSCRRAVSRRVDEGRSLAQIFCADIA